VERYCNKKHAKRRQLVAMDEAHHDAMPIDVDGRGRRKAVLVKGLVGRHKGKRYMRAQSARQDVVHG